jgi:hypothetical protein
MFDYPTILQEWEELPDRRIRFAPGESGWAKQLDATHYCIANVPLSAGLKLYDIVTMRQEDGLAQVETIVQSRFTQQWGVRYPLGQTVEETKAIFAQLWQACEAQGGYLEGMVEGMAVCNAPSTMDVETVLCSAGVDGVTCEQYGDPADTTPAPPVWTVYRRTGITELRLYVPGEDLTGISVSSQDTPQAGGYIARNPTNHADQWYVNAEYVAQHLEALL